MFNRIVFIVIVIVTVNGSALQEENILNFWNYSGWYKKNIIETNIEVFRCIWYKNIIGIMLNFFLKY